MALTLYAETNLLVGFAKGRHGLPIPDPFGSLRPFRVMIPGVCVMEAFSRLEAEIKQWNRVKESLNSPISDARRDVASGHAASLLIHLERAITEGGFLLNEVRSRLGSALDWLTEHAEILPLDAESVQACLRESLLEDPTDNLIFHVIHRHALAAAAGPRAFVSANYADFGLPDVANALNAAGVRYFRDVEAAVGWLQSQTDS